MKYTKSFKKTKGFGRTMPTREEFLKGIEQSGRALIAVMPEGADDPRPVAFTYSVPSEDVVEPVMLTSYPSDKTPGWLLNSLGDHFRENGWEGVPEDSEMLLEGFLGLDGEHSIAVRLLTEEESERSHEHFTCQADPRVPVILVTIPDLAFRFPWEEGCNPIVAWSESLLVSTLNGVD